MEILREVGETSFKLHTEVSPAFHHDLLMFIYRKYIVPHYYNFANVRRWIIDGKETLAFTILGSGLWYVDVEITAGDPFEIKMRPYGDYFPQSLLSRIKEDLIVLFQMFEDEIRKTTLYFAWVPGKHLTSEKMLTQRKKFLSQIFTGNMLMLFVIFILFSYMIFAFFGPTYAPIILVLSQFILILFSDKIIMQMGDWPITKESPTVHILQYHIPPEDFDFIRQNYPRERLLQIKREIYEKTLALGKPIDAETVQEVFMNHGINIKPENLLIKSIDVYQIVNTVAKRFNMPIPKIRIANIIIPNAAATGPSPRFSLILVTTGLLIQLDEEEITAVIGHEISHVKGRDPLSLFMLTSAEYLFRVYILLQITPFIMMFGFLYFLFALSLIYFIAKFFEARADLESALVLGKSDALANALRKIGYRRLWFEKASSRVGSWLGLDPHPPLSFRIERLENLKSLKIKHPLLQSMKDCINGLFRDIGL
ncbi:MAG: M48 family metalloprotease [Candidatus Bathyarchaeota archaeon]|nr:M48 family metalloprotease [Candidatus Bathyarchaeota archaeon]